MARLGKSAPARFTALYEKAAKEGWGYHEQMLKAASLMKDLGVEPGDAIQMMEKAGDEVTRRRQEPGEIRRVVGFVYQNEYTPKPYDTPKHGVKAQPGLIQEFARNGSIKRLMGQSQTIPQTMGEVLAKLYEPTALLHLSPHHCQPQDVKSCKEWIQSDLTDRQYICPAHLKSREVGRRNDNVMHRHYIVYESDRDGLAGNWDAQAGIIERLAQDLPLRLCVASGNQSIHSWFDCTTRRKDQVKDFITKCVELGADPACLRPAQLVRAPWGVRTSNGKTQKVIYYAD